jgi:DNA-binding NtrC family response regulator
VAGSKRILIVDDEAQVLYIMSTALRMLHANLDIVVAHSGRQALNEIADRCFDLIITDLKRPGVSGLELTEAVRSLDPGTAVVWMTAHGCYRVRDDSRRLGVYRCLDKPVDIGRIRQVTLEALGTQVVERWTNAKEGSYGRQEATR